MLKSAIQQCCFRHLSYTCTRHCYPRVMAGAPEASLYVADAEGNGNVGVGTDSPATKLHVVSGICPALRLEQDGSEGFLSQVWDVKIEDTDLVLESNGVVIVRIASDAPENSLVIDSNGDLNLVGTVVRRRNLQEHQKQEDNAAETKEDVVATTTTPTMLGGVVLVSAFEENGGRRAHVTLSKAIPNGFYHVTLTSHTNDSSALYHANVMNQDEQGFDITLSSSTTSQENNNNMASSSSSLQQVSWMVQAFPSDSYATMA